MQEGVGERFQLETKYSREGLPGKMLDWANKPDIYKTYPGTRRVELPAFGSIKAVPLTDALRARRSIRHFSGRSLALEQLSYLLWAAGGIQRVERDHEFRTVPSAGALYPVETYLMIDGVEDLDPGVYHYSVGDHALELLKSGQFGHDMAQAALGQKMCLEAAAVFIWTAIFQRSKWKYDERAYRYIYLDAGHIGQNLALAATAIGLGTCQIGALFDDEVNGIIGVDGDAESVIYMSVVGEPA
jgi:SagB-type dehydrogenase family enzyme